MPGEAPLWGEHEIDYLLIARPEADVSFEPNPGCGPSLHSTSPLLSLPYLFHLFCYSPLLPVPVITMVVVVVVLLLLILFHHHGDREVSAARYFSQADLRAFVATGAHNNNTAAAAVAATTSGSSAPSSPPPLISPWFLHIGNPIQPSQSASQPANQPASQYQPSALPFVLP